MLEVIHEKLEIATDNVSRAGVEDQVLEEMRGRIRAAFCAEVAKLTTEIAASGYSGNVRAEAVESFELYIGGNAAKEVAQGKGITSPDTLALVNEFGMRHANLLVCLEQGDDFS